MGFRRRFAVLLIVGAVGSAGFAAQPPSRLTDEEKAWRAFSAAAQDDLGGAAAQNAADLFAKKFPTSALMPRIRYFYAERFFRKKQYEKAAVIFEKLSTAFAKEPFADSALYRLGECYLNLMVTNSAQTAWERLLAEHPKSSLVSDAMEQLALLQMRQEQWGRADELFRRIEKEHPEIADRVSIKENHAAVEYHLGDYTDSAHRAESVDTEKAAYYRGLSLFSLQLFDDAAAALKGAVAGASGPYVESASFLKAESFFQKKNYSVADHAFADFLKRFPKSNLAPYAHLRRAAAALLTKNDADAIAFADLARSPQAPFEVRVFGDFIKASGLMHTKRFAPAIELFGSVAARPEFPDLAAAALVRQGWCQKQDNQLTAADATLKLVSDKFPTSAADPLARYLRGCLLFEQARWEDAGQSFESATLGHRYTPLSESALGLMCLSYTKAGRRDRLVTAANAALKLFEKNFASEGLYWRAPAYMLIGEAYAGLGRHAEAVPYFEKVFLQFADHPLAPRARLLAAWSLNESGQSAKARDRARSLLDAPDTDASLKKDAAFLYASAVFNGKDYDGAAVRFADYVKAYPQDDRAPQAQYLVALSFYQKKVMGSALDEWQRLIDQYPDSPLAQDAYLHVADLSFRAHDYAKSAERFRQFREKWPTSSLAETAMWQELQCYYNGKDDETAIKAYPAYLDKFPSSPNAASAAQQLEMVYFRRGANGDPQKLEEFLAKYPKSPYAPDARFKLGDMAVQQKVWARAIDEMQRYLADYPSGKDAVSAMYGLALAYENAGFKDKAVMQYRNIMDRFADKPGAVDAAFRVAALHFDEKRYQEAAEAFEFASKKKLTADQQASVAYNLALCYENLGRLEDAAASQRRFAELTKDPAQKRDALMAASLLYKKAEKPADAVPVLKALLKDPGDPTVALQATNLLAESYKNAGREKDAIATYETLVGMEPASADLRVAGLAQLAFLYEQKKDLKRAIAVYEKIAISEGKPQWVDAAKARIQALNTQAAALP